MLPMGSMCLIGFRVTRPSMRAVWSPRRLAIHACADSCTLMASRNTTSCMNALTAFRLIRRDSMVAEDCRPGRHAPGRLLLLCRGFHGFRRDGLHLDGLRGNPGDDVVW